MQRESVCNSPTPEPKSETNNAHPALKGGERERPAPQRTRLVPEPKSEANNAHPAPKGGERERPAPQRTSPVPEPKSEANNAQPAPKGGEREGQRPSSPGPGAMPLVYFFSMAGCRRRCVYCDQNAITGSRFPDIEEARGRIKSLSSPAEIRYFGGSFTCMPERIQTQWLDLVRLAPAGSTVRFSTHPQCVDERTISIFSEYPVSVVELGVSSLDDRVLSLSNRGYTGGEVLRVISDLLGLGFRVCAQMMIGLPGQTVESSLNDLSLLDEARRGRDMSLRIYPCLVLKNTPLEGLFRSGAFVPLNAEQAAEQAGELIRSARLRGYEIYRVGLQETESLAGSVVAGPHHPALGEMAFAHALAREMYEDGVWTLPRRYISQMTGHGRLGIRKLASLCGLPEETVEDRIKFL